MGNVLVTGAAGQIGSELVVQLRRRHPDQVVVAADVSTVLPPGVQEHGPNIVLDVTDEIQMTKTFDEHGVDTVYHLAGLLSSTGEQKPHLAWNVNVGGLYNVLEAARTKNARVFWPSSIAVFGPDSPRVETPQNTVMIPNTIYGVSKVAGELTVQLLPSSVRRRRQERQVPRHSQQRDSSRRGDHRLRRPHVLRGD